MGDRIKAASSHHQSAFWNSSTMVSRPMSAKAEKSAYARNPITASLRSEPQVTRCSGSSGGISLPVRAAISSRRALRSSFWSCRALRVSHSNAAGCRNGSTSTSPSSPITSAARGDRTVGVERERGGHEQLRPVGAHRTLRRADLGGAEARERRRTVGPNDQALGVHLPVRDPELVEASGAPANSRARARRRCRRLGEPSVRPFASITRIASL